MKGIILAGASGTRLYPLTMVTINRPVRKFCVKRDKQQSKEREQIKGLPKLGRAPLN